MQTGIIPNYVERKNECNCFSRDHTVLACRDAFVMPVITWWFCILHPENTHKCLWVCEPVCMHLKGMVIRWLFIWFNFYSVSFQRSSYASGRRFSPRRVQKSHLVNLVVSYGSNPFFLSPSVNECVFCARLEGICVCMCLRVQTHFPVNHIWIIPLSMFSTVLAEKERECVCVIW